MLECGCGLGINALSKEERESTDEQTRTVHALAYAGSSFRDHNFIERDVLQWYRKFKSPVRPAVGLYGVSPLTKLFQDLNIPTVDLTHYGLTDLLSR